MTSGQELSSVHYFTLTESTHRMLSSDISGYWYLDNDNYGAFETHLDETGQALFLRHLKEADEGWFPANVLRQGQALPVLLSVRRENGFLTVTLTDAIMMAKELLELRVKDACSQAIGRLYGDSYWSYSYTRKEVTLFATERSSIATGRYKKEEFLSLIRRNLNQANRDALAVFVDQISHEPGGADVVLSEDPLTGEGGSGLYRIEAIPVSDGSRDEVLTGLIRKIDNGKDDIQGPLQKLDPLTGLYSRSEIIKVASSHVQSGRKTALVMLDIDFFKRINDRCGHQKGDEVLHNVAETIRNIIGDAGTCGRYGGDEFLIVLDQFETEGDIRRYLSNIKNAARQAYPDTGEWDQPSVTVSIGCALFPTDAGDYDSLLELADACLYLAKRKGRNRYIIYTREKHGEPHDFIARMIGKQQEIDRPGTNPAEILVDMTYSVRRGERKPEPQDLLERYAAGMGIPAAALLSGTPAKLYLSSGDQSISQEDIEELNARLLRHPEMFREKDFLFVNDAALLPPDTDGTREFMQNKGFLAVILITFRDKTGAPCSLLLYTPGRHVQWNQQHFRYHQLFSDLLARYDLSRN